MGHREPAAAVYHSMAWLIATRRHDGSRDRIECTILGYPERAQLAWAVVPIGDERIEPPTGRMRCDPLHGDAIW